jgi:hypothetical protein
VCGKRHGRERKKGNVCVCRERHGKEGERQCVCVEKGNVCVERSKVRERSNVFV